MPYAITFVLGVAAGWLCHKYWSGIKEVFCPEQSATKVDEKKKM